MSKSRRIRKAVYAVTIAVSIAAGTFTGHTARNNTADIYPEPYAGRLFGLERTYSNAERFTDMYASDWFYPYVNSLAEKGIIAGKTTYEFQPYGTLTVPECAAIITRCLGLESTASKELSELSRNGMNDWCAGYMKVCIDAGIIETDIYGYGYDKNGNFVRKDPKALAVPVKRYELAAFLSRLTTLDGVNLKAKNIYAERGGNGHEFIRGGMYDIAAAEQYKKDITDFASIPDAYKDSVLKCYYNALFNGDTYGNFNPQENLTRAEMSKLAAALTDMSLRFGKDYREQAYTIDDSHFRKNTEGERVLKKQAGYEILKKCAEKLQLLDGGYLRVPMQAVCPIGYTAEVYVYIGDQNGYTEVGKINHTVYGSYGNGTYIDCGILGAPGVKVLYILRNTAAGGDVEGVLEANISGNAISFSDAVSRM